MSSSLIGLSVGRYRLCEPIGNGSMGEVWRAEDPQIDRLVAVKILNVPEPLSPALRAEWESRFLREARAAGRLSHPGIVAIHDVGTSEDGRPFIVMEFVEGRSLDGILCDGQEIPERQALEWGAQIAEALDCAHGKGIVHRDVKPANILIDATGRVRVADFGIARLSESELTREGSFLGSPAFASPEQLRGLPVDGRSDLFSLGAVLYTLLTGMRPFRGEDVGSLVYEICHVIPAAPRRLSPGLSASSEAVVLKLLSKDAEARHASGLELAAALRAAAAADDGAAGAPGRGERTVVAEIASEKGPRRSGRTARAGMILSVAVVMGGMVWGALTILGHGHRSDDVLAPDERRGSVVDVAAPAKSSPAVPASPARVSTEPAEQPHRTARAKPGPVSTEPAEDPRRAPVREDAADPEPGPLLGSTLAETGEIIVRVTHGLPDGELTIWWAEQRILSKRLDAREKDVEAFGRKVFSYRRRESVDIPLRLAEGKHGLRVRVRSRERDLDLTSEMTKRVDAGGRYELEVSVRSMPSPKLDLDWSNRDQEDEP